MSEPESVGTERVELLMLYEVNKQLLELDGNRAVK
jgi:hypothetical protein